MTYPIIYKMIPVQHAFYVHEDGTLQITQVTDVPKQMKFKNEDEARNFVYGYKKQY